MWFQFMDMIKNKKKQQLFLLLILMFFLSLNIWFLDKALEKQILEKGFVVRVIDGDTIELKSGEKVRLLGINTPEKSEKYFKESKELLEEFILNKNITMEKDDENTDRYGRKLRYIYVSKENNQNKQIFVNLMLLGEGLAHTYMIEKSRFNKEIKYKNKFLNAEKKAIEEEKGIWKYSNKKYVLDNCIKIKEFHNIEENNMPVNEYIIFENTCNYDINMNDWTIKDEATHIYKFKDFVLKYNSYFKLITGKCENTGRQLCWNQKNTVWNDDIESVFLRNNYGELVLFFTIKP